MTGVSRRRKRGFMDGTDKLPSLHNGKSIRDEAIDLLLLKSAEEIVQPIQIHHSPNALFSADFALNDLRPADA